MEWSPNTAYTVLDAITAAAVREDTVSNAGLVNIATISHGDAGGSGLNEDELPIRSDGPMDGGAEGDEEILAELDASEFEN